MAVNITSNEETKIGFRTGRDSLYLAEGIGRWLKAAFQSPLTFVLLVWAAMFLMTVLFLTVIE